MTEPFIAAVLQRLKTQFDEASGEFVGYPCNLQFDYGELLPFLNYSINNIGDPFAPSNYRVTTREQECEVINTYAEWTHAPMDNVWGYVTNGGTEGNMYGLYLAREMYPDGMVYFCEETHYSVTKILHVLGARNIMIRGQANGEMDYDDLRETLRLHRDVPPIIFANIGTTMKGAVDNIPKIKQIMKELAISRYYIHSDAALSGMILPFVDNPQPFDFSAGADSISVSGHKLVGSPMPCGIVLAKKDNVRRIARSIEYIGAMDTTIMGSRNGFTPLLLWYAFTKLGREGLRDIVQTSLERTEYALNAFQKAGIDAWCNENSITVVFPRPSDSVIAKWQIAPYLDIAHMITLPHVTETMIDAVIADVAASLAQDKPEITGSAIREGLAA